MKEEVSGDFDDPDIPDVPAHPEGEGEDSDDRAPPEVPLASPEPSKQMKKTKKNQLKKKAMNVLSRE